MYSIDKSQELDEQTLEELIDEEHSSARTYDILSEIYGIDSPQNEKKQEIPIVWDRYKQFSPAFLAKYQDFVLCDIFHHIKALLLFPPKCSCKSTCQCLHLREKIALTLNVQQYTDAQRVEPAHRLRAMKHLCYIPEDHVFRALHPDAYPLWAIKKEWKMREKKGHFIAVDRLVRTFLRLGQTSQYCFGVPEASLSDAISIIVGDKPIKSKALNHKGSELRLGEKTYGKLYKRYTSVCHFIAALEYCKKDIPNWEYLFINTVYSPLAFTEKFLKVAHWFRKNLLLLKKPNVTDKIFLKEEELYPLPSWVDSQDIDIPIEPFQGKLKDILGNAVRIDPATKTATKIDLYAEYLEACSHGGGELDGI